MIVEPEGDPERIIERMNRLVEKTASGRKTTSLEDAVGPVAQNHWAAVRNSGETDTDD